MPKVTQRQRVLQYCKEHKNITRLKAATEIGCFELASRILELEAEGHKFDRKMAKGKNRYGDTVRWMVYTLVE
jgi:hypothetical protein